MYLLCMIKARIRWCTCRVENILTLGKLLSLWFCFLLLSILFLISQTSYRRPVMGTIFLVLLARRNIYGYSNRARWFLPTNMADRMLHPQLYASGQQLYTIHPPSKAMYEHGIAACSANTLAMNMGRLHLTTCSLHQHSDENRMYSLLV